MLAGGGVLMRRGAPPHSSFDKLRMNGGGAGDWGGRWLVDMGGARWWAPLHSSFDKLRMNARRGWGLRGGDGWLIWGAPGGGRPPHSSFDKLRMNARRGWGLGGDGS